MKLYFNRTQPLRELQKHIGLSTYQLNTIFVGLQCIASGKADKSDARKLHIGWELPKKENINNIANQAKIFACTSALLFGADIVDFYLRSIVKQEWAPFELNIVQVVTKQCTKDNGEAYSMKERAQKLYSFLELQDDYQSSTLSFLWLWRNLIAHKQNNRKEKLDKKIRKDLLSQKDYFLEKYAHIDIERSIKNYIDNKVPKSKEIVFLLAIATNICKEIDKAIINHVTSTEKRIISFAEKLLLIYFKENPTIFDSWQGSKKKDNLIKILQQVGFSKIESNQTSTRAQNISCALPEKYINELSSLNRNDIIDKFTSPNNK